MRVTATVVSLDENAAHVLALAFPYLLLAGIMMVYDALLNVFLLMTKLYQAIENRSNFKLATIALTVFAEIISNIMVFGYAFNIVALESRGVPFVIWRLFVTMPIAIGMISIISMAKKFFYIFHQETKPEEIKCQIRLLKLFEYGYGLVIIGSLFFGLYIQMVKIPASLPGLVGATVFLGSQFPLSILFFVYGRMLGKRLIQGIDISNQNASETEVTRKRRDFVRRIRQTAIAMLLNFIVFVAFSMFYEKSASHFLYFVALDDDGAKSRFNVYYHHY